MIFEITTDENKEYACADSILQVLQGYCRQLGEGAIWEVVNLREISEEEAKEFDIFYDDDQETLWECEQRREIGDYHYVGSSDE